MLINYIEFFPKAQTFIARQLREAVDVPVIIHYAVADAPPVLFFGGPVLALFDDSLLWRKTPMTQGHGSWTGAGARADSLQIPYMMQCNF